MTKYFNSGILFLPPIAIKFFGPNCTPEDDQLGLNI
jgi:hypothetical protein